MKWHADKIKEFKTRTINGKKYVGLDEVVELLCRQCRTCKHYTVRREDNKNPRRAPKHWGYCTSAPNMYKTNERLTNGSDAACKRYEAAEQ